jgi:hypothetical protein
MELIPQQVDLSGGRVALAGILCRLIFSALLHNFYLDPPWGGFGCFSKRMS